MRAQASSSAPSRAKPADRLLHLRPEGLVRALRPGDAENRELLGQEVAQAERVERRDQLPAREVAGGAVDDDDAGIGPPPKPQPLEQRIHLGRQQLHHVTSLGTTKSRSLSPLRFSVRLRTRASGSEPHVSARTTSWNLGYLAEEHVGAGARPTRGGRAPRAELEALGAVPLRAAVGHGARGLLAERRRLGVLPARSRAQPRLPLGRGRPARDLRSRVPGRLRARAVERARSDPQGAAVRADRPRGQSRRGRQGAVLLPRRHADALVREGAVQVSAGARSRTRGSSTRTGGAAESEPRVRARRHRRVRRRPLLRRLRRVREGRARTTC